MRPYLAILIDSFREALASWTLWVLLLLITAFLLVLAPVSFREQSESTLTRAALTDGPGLAREVVAASVVEKPTPGQRVWARLNDSARQHLRGLSETNGAAAPTSSPDAAFEELRAALNDTVLNDRDFHDPVAWKGFSMRREAIALAKRRAELRHDEVRRLNRLALEAAFPSAITRSSDPELYAMYFGWQLVPLEFPPAQLRLVIQAALAALMVVLVGVLGVMAALVVTSSIVPHTFEPGAIDLLLSKPISRSLMFLTKFVGGCAFIFICATYLVGGLWLLCGLRYGVWSEKLPLCIPIFLFLFSIYYAVSAVAGVVWKNPIVSIIVTVLFWGLCFTVGTTKTLLEGLYLEPIRVDSILLTGSDVLVRDRSGVVSQWSETTGTWEPVMTPSGTPGHRFFKFNLTSVPPLYDAPRERLILIESEGDGMRRQSAEGSLVVALHRENWKQHKSTRAPSGTVRIAVDNDGTLLTAAPGGLSRFSGDPLLAADKKPATPTRIFGFDFGTAPPDNQFVPLDPEFEPSWSEPFDAIDLPGGEWLVYSQGRLQRLKRDKQHVTLAVERDLETDAAAWLATRGEQVFVALGTGEIRVFDRATLEPRGEYRPFEVSPRSTAVSADGRWLAVLFNNGRLWLWDNELGSGTVPRLWSQGDLSAVAFGPDGRLWLADQFTRLTAYQPGTWQREQRLTPQRDFVTLAYLHAAVPIYAAFPKPGELNQLASRLLTEDSVSEERASNKVQRVGLLPSLWEPVTSNAGFLVVVLGLGCLYISRKDF